MTRSALMRGALTRGALTRGALTRAAHVVGVVAALVGTGVLWAQPASVAGTRLDAWLVMRYRGAGLLPDTASTTPSFAATRTPPRIESIASGEATDTLWAVHFANAEGAPAFAVNATARFTSPTGAVSPLSARVAARRPFRAPRTPNASPARDSSWRTGWAYLLLLPHDDRRAATRYRGWLLLSAPRTAPLPRATSVPR